MLWSEGSSHKPSPDPPAGWTRPLWARSIHPSSVRAEHPSRSLLSSWALRDTRVGGGGDDEQAHENKQPSNEHCSFLMFTTAREIRHVNVQVQRQDVNDLSHYDSEMSWRCGNNIKWQQRVCTCGDASSLSPLIQVRGSAAIACEDEDVPHVTQGGRSLLAWRGRTWQGCPFTYTGSMCCLGLNMVAKLIRRFS